MARNSLPTYAIVELLIRLNAHDDSIGDYKDHTMYDDEVIVKTSNGTIRLTQALVQQQFEAPETITENELVQITSAVRKAN
ncbi:MAG TPA: hypothetical protein VHC47_03575 [Mucilaginibacter sp.]|nr:hypothetical protein [Mucilaginibacter sp.]